MLKKTIKYTDYEGNEREEDFYFNLTRAECVKLQLGTDGGLEKTLRKIIAEQDVPKIIPIFEQIVLGAYGEKSPDGKRFVKSKELSEAFSQTEAYSDLFMELMSDADAAAAFINGIIPQIDAPAQEAPTTNLAAVN